MNHILENFAKQNKPSCPAQLFENWAMETHLTSIVKIVKRKDVFLGAFALGYVKFATVWMAVDTTMKEIKRAHGFRW